MRVDRVDSFPRVGGEEIELDKSGVERLITSGLECINKTESLDAIRHVAFIDRIQNRLIEIDRKHDSGNTSVTLRSSQFEGKGIIVQPILEAEITAFDPIRGWANYWQIRGRIDDKWVRQIQEVLDFILKDD